MPARHNCFPRPQAQDLRRKQHVGKKKLAFSKVAPCHNIRVLIVKKRGGWHFGGQIAISDTALRKTLRKTPWCLSDGRGSPPLIVPLGQFLALLYHSFSHQTYWCLLIILFLCLLPTNLYPNFPSFTFKVFIPYLASQQSNGAETWSWPNF